MHKKEKTVSFADPPVITGHAGVAGKKEGEGPLGGDFDAVFADTGSAVLESKGEGVRIRAVHIGTITDYGITDAGNMGAAMAPAAARTIHDLLEDSATTPADYDRIVTGDLGAVGTKLLYQLMEQDWGIQLAGHHKDCGMMIYDLKSQDVNAGGSGCGCGGSVLCSHILKKMEQGALRKVLFVATGALMSPTSTKQGNSIPGVAHGVVLEV